MSIYVCVQITLGRVNDDVYTKSAESIEYLNCITIMLDWALNALYARATTFSYKSLIKKTCQQIKCTKKNEVSFQ